jgi:hypothetical protein
MVPFSISKSCVDVLNPVPLGKKQAQHSIPSGRCGSLFVVKVMCMHLHGMSSDQSDSNRWLHGFSDGSGGHGLPNIPEKSL